MLDVVWYCNEPGRSLKVVHEDERLEELLRKVTDTDEEPGLFICCVVPAVTDCSVYNENSPNIYHWCFYTQRFCTDFSRGRTLALLVPHTSLLGSQVVWFLCTARCKGAGQNSKEWDISRRLPCAGPRELVNRRRITLQLETTSYGYLPVSRWRESSTCL